MTEPTTDYYTDLVALLVHLNRYLAGKNTERTARRNAIYKYMNRIYRDKPEIAQAVKDAITLMHVEIKENEKKGRNGMD